MLGLGRRTEAPPNQNVLMKVFDEAVVTPARKRHAKLILEKVKKVVAIDGDELLKKKRRQ